MEGLDFDTAKMAFIRVRDIRYLELIHSIEVGLYMYVACHGLVVKCTRLKLWCF